MFKQQEIILSASPVLRRILEQHSWKSSPENWLELAEKESRQFVVTLPLVGAFNAGKSTLLNALIGKNLYSTSIEPQTTYPAELSYGINTKLIGHLPDGAETRLTFDDLRGDLTSLLPKGSYTSVTLPHPLLARLSHLRLVDMPGWDSGIEAHASAIDSYAARSLAYCAVVGADEGSLRESELRALRELAIRDMPILVVISKADKKPPEDVDAVAEHVRQQITSAIGRPPLAVVKVSSRKNQLDELIAALEQLEGQAEQLFARNVTQTLVAKLGSFYAHLNTLINNDDLDSEKIQAQCEQLNTSMAQFATRLDDETRQLEARVQPVLGRIVDQIGIALRVDIESLTSEALHGGDLSGNIGSTVRLAAQKAISTEFSPEIERYLNRVVDGLPEDFSPEINCTFDYRVKSGNEAPALVLTPILTLLRPLLKIRPELNVIVNVVLGVVSLLESMFANEKQKQVDEARQREAVQQKIVTTVIPDTLRQVRAVLQPMLEEHIQSAKQKIADTVRAQQESHGAALRELQTKLAAGQAEFAAARTQYQSDRGAVAELITNLENA